MTVSDSLQCVDREEPVKPQIFPSNRIKGAIFLLETTKCKPEPLYPNGGWLVYCKTQIALQKKVQYMNVEHKRQHGLTADAYVVIRGW